MGILFKATLQFHICSSSGSSHICMAVGEVRSAASLPCFSREMLEALGLSFPGVHFMHHATYTCLHQEVGGGNHRLPCYLALQGFVLLGMSFQIQKYR